MNIKDIPKVELHVHLDGSINLELAKKLSKKEDVYDLMVAPSNCKDLNDYLTKFSFPVSLMQTKENLIEIAREFAKDLVKDNVIYAEVRFAPLKHLEKGLTLEEVVESILEGLRQVDVKTNLILSMMRNDKYEDNVKVIALAEKYLNKGVVALDLAGAEALFPTKDFEKLFKLAQEKNIPYTIHAGEADGVSSIESAIFFKSKRIGHGVRSIDDINTIKKLKEEKITLEVCPTSNIQTRICDSYETHPINELYKKVLVTINTDNRTVSNTTLSKEYSNLKKIGFKDSDFIIMNINAIEASFLSTREKQNLLNLYRKKVTKKDNFIY